LFYARVPIYIVTLLVDCLFVFTLFKNKATNRKLYKYWQIDV